MELAVITAKQVAVLFLLIFAGFACVKTGAVKIEAKKAFSDLLLYLIVTAMVINSYLTEFDPKVLQNLLQSFALSTVLLLLGLVITFLLTLRIGKEKNTPILRFACIFSNAAYMGFPLIQALFGAEVVLLLEACPCAAITSVFAVQFGYDEDLAAGSVVITAFISIVVLPLCAMALTMML